MQNERDLPTILRLEKERKRLKLSHHKMAELLMLTSNEYTIFLDEQIDFDIKDLPVSVFKSLQFIGVNMFYIVTGKEAGSSVALN